MTLMMDELVVPSDDYVRRRQNSVNGATVTIAITPVNNPMVGDLAILFFFVFNNTTTARPTEPIPAGWTQMGSYHTAVLGGFWGQAFVCYKVLTAADIGATILSRAGVANVVLQWRLTYFTLQRPFKVINSADSKTTSSNTIGVATTPITLSGTMPRVYGDYYSTGVTLSPSTVIIPTYTDPAFSPITNHNGNDFFRFEGHPVYNLNITSTQSLASTSSHMFTSIGWVSLD